MLHPQTLLSERNYASLILLTMSTTLFTVWLVAARDSKESMRPWRQNVFQRYGSFESKREIAAGADTQQQKKKKVRTVQLFHLAELPFATQLQAVSEEGVSFRSRVMACVVLTQLSKSGEAFSMTRFMPTIRVYKKMKQNLTSAVVPISSGGTTSTTRTKSFKVPCAIKAGEAKRLYVCPLVPCECVC